MGAVLLVRTIGGRLLMVAAFSDGTFTAIEACFVTYSSAKGIFIVSY
jgi:hypothetical protein